MAPQPDNRAELLVVYNADRGFFNTVFSSIHKTLSPETYTCELCRLSYGMTGMIGAWKTYLEYLPLSVRSFHRDQFRDAFPNLRETRLPAILSRGADGRCRELLGADAINSAGNLTTLINLLDEALAKKDADPPEGTDADSGA